MVITRKIRETWVPRRFPDALLHRTFPHIGTVRYWRQEVLDLRGQISFATCSCASPINPIPFWDPSTERVSDSRVISGSR